MAIKTNATGIRTAKRLIGQGNVNHDVPRSFDAADGNTILGENEDWAKYSSYYLAIDTARRRVTKYD